MTKHSLVFLFMCTSLSFPLMVISVTASTANNSNTDNLWELPEWFTNPTITPSAPIEHPVVPTTNLNSAIAQFSTNNPAVLPKSSNTTQNTYLKKYGTAFDMLEKTVTDTLNSDTFKNNSALQTYTYNRLIALANMVAPS